MFLFFFFFNDTATTEIYTLSLHDALPISGALTEKQVEQGGAALLTWLPAGEFQIAAVPGSAEGKIVIDRALWLGKVVPSPTPLFRQGQLNITYAASGLAPVPAPHEPTGASQDRLRRVGIRLNPQSN